MPSIRFYVPPGRELVWEDLVYGFTSFQSNDLGDFVIRRANGSPIYNFANVVDDHDMEISVALRGQSHLTNTPRQMLLYEALGWAAPQFAHVPDVLDSQGRKMGKRFGAKGVTEYRDDGYLPEAVVNYLALLGWSSPSDDEFLSMDELAKQFSFDRVQRSNATFDPDRLEWFNAQYIRRMPIEQFVDAVTPFLHREGLHMPGTSSDERERLRLILPLVHERVRTLAQVPPLLTFFYSEISDLDASSFRVKQHSANEIGAALNRITDSLSGLTSWTADEILAAATGSAESMQWKRGDLLMAMRVAITGREVTPPLTESMELLGKPVSLDRLRKASTLLQEIRGS